MAENILTSAVVGASSMKSLPFYQESRNKHRLSGTNYYLSVNPVAESKRFSVINLIRVSSNAHDLVIIDNFKKLRFHVIRIPNIFFSPRQSAKTVENRKKDRLRKLERSYYKNLTEEIWVQIPEALQTIREKADGLISNIPFVDCIVAYNKYDECWNYILQMKYNLEVRVNIFEESGLDEVDFVISRAGKLLVVDSMELKSLEEKLNTVIKRVSE